MLLFLIGAVCVAGFMLIVAILLGGPDTVGKIWWSVLDLFMAAAIALYATRLLPQPALAPLAYASYVIGFVHVILTNLLIFGNPQSLSGLFDLFKWFVTTFTLELLCLVCVFLIRRWNGTGAVYASSAVGMGAGALYSVLLISIMWGTGTVSQDVWRVLLILLILVLIPLFVTPLLARLNRKAEPVFVQ